MEWTEPIIKYTASWKSVCLFLRELIAWLLRGRQPSGVLTHRGGKELSKILLRGLASCYQSHKANLFTEIKTNKNSVRNLIGLHKQTTPKLGA